MYHHDVAQQHPAAICASQDPRSRDPESTAHLRAASNCSIFQCRNLSIGKDRKSSQLDSYSLFVLKWSPKIIHFLSHYQWENHGKPIRGTHLFYFRKPPYAPCMMFATGRHQGIPLPIETTDDEFLDDDHWISLVGGFKHDYYFP